MLSVLVPKHLSVIVLKTQPISIDEPNMYT